MVKYPHGPLLPYDLGLVLRVGLRLGSGLGVRVKDRVMVIIVFSYNIWFPLSVQWRSMNAYLSNHHIYFKILCCRIEFLMSFTYLHV